VQAGSYDVADCDELCLDPDHIQEPYIYGLCVPRDEWPSNCIRPGGDPYGVEDCTTPAGDCACCDEYIPSSPPPPATPTPGPPGKDPLCPDGGINTAIGCIPFNNITQFSGFFLRWTLGIGGGIAFVLIIFAGFMITTSAGNPQKIQAGKELLTAAIAGLALIIFSVFILELIGVRILQLPGL
jgi:hypothetical protein